LRANVKERNVDRMEKTWFWMKDIVPVDLETWEILIEGYYNAEFYKAVVSTMISMKNQGYLPSMTERKKKRLMYFRSYNLQKNYCFLWKVKRSGIN
jgi:hypothetical protein